MKIRLDQVDHPFDWQETLELTAAEIQRSELSDLSEIVCKGRIQPAVEGLLLRASMGYEQTLRCMRCLGEVTTPMSIQIDLLIEIGSSEAGEEERQLQHEDLGILQLAEPQFDTQPILIEQVQLGIPMKPLCKDDCAGLCTSCGADLNQGPCGCGRDTDPRWAALAGLQLKPTRH